MAYWQLVPFFPKFLREHQISKEYLGYIISVFALSFIISSLFTGKFLLKYINRVNGCFIGALFVIVNLLGLGSLSYMTSNSQIITFAFIFQMLGGIGNGINSPCTIAVLSSYKENRETYIGYFEVCAGIGGIIGPLLGSAIYFLGGFQAPFFVIGSGYFVVVVGFYLITKSRKVVHQQGEELDSD